jgi:DNA-binding MarR family transcriptional regulator
MRSIVQTYETFIATANQALRQHQLSPAGRQALAILDGAGTPLSPTVIAERLLVTTASVTSLLDTLERRSLVTRSPDPADRRRVLVALTSDGKRAVDAFLPQMVALQTAMVSGLSEARRRQLLESLAVIRETVAALDSAQIVAAAPPRRGTTRRR